MEYFTTENLVWTVFFAVLCAVVYAFILQRVLCGLVRRLTKREAVDPDSAQTLEQLGYRNAVTKAAARYFAAGGSVLARGIVKVGTESKRENNEELFAEKTRIAYFLPPESRTKIFEKHAGEKVPLAKLAVLLVLLLAVALAATWVIDFLGNYAYNLVKSGENGPVGAADESDQSLLDEQDALNREEQEEKKRQETEQKENASETDKDDAADDLGQPESGDEADAQSQGQSAEKTENAVPQQEK